MSIPAMIDRGALQNAGNLFPDWKEANNKPKAWKTLILSREQ